ncbi:MAG: hypothetical protein CMO80_21660 [Verrucomicrobiales bacterium]|nr:hypothetical protein [Verrucomicrobiales bacterium]|tara:strand:- start:10554 stop:12401 length:1848 start_codon:yes stop_codon:yes gene_type:complete
MRRFTFFLCAFLTVPVFADKLVAIRKGKIEAATGVAHRWEEGKGYIYSTGSHYIFADKGIGQSDFTVRARLMLEQLNGSAAAFVFGDDKFGFEGGHRRMFLQGPRFTSGPTIGEPMDFITPGKPFEFVAARKGNVLTFVIDGKEVFRTPYDVTDIRAIGLRPWRTTMRIYDFSIEGNLIQAKIPTLTAVSKLRSWEKSLAVRRKLQAQSGNPGFSNALLGASAGQLEILERTGRAGVMEVEPVTLPTNPEGENDHHGWPVATMIDDTIIVVHRIMPGHNPRVSGEADTNTTYAAIVRSNDGGKTWSMPYDVRDCMLPEDRNRGGFIPLCHRFKFAPANRSPLGYKLHLNGLGTTRDGAVVLATDHGVFRSEDKGKTWKHLRMAFREDRHEGPFAYVGPRIIDDPKHGLLIFAHHTIYRFRRPVDIARELAVYRSRDRGESWEKTALKLPEWCKPAEPDVISHDGRFVAIVRNQAPANILAQMRFGFGEAEITDVANTPMKTMVSVDTSAICFNPMSRRYEVVQSKREDMSIHLWSIAPEEWASAKWRHEGRLLKRSAGMYEFADGFHTGGAVMDEGRGVQHVFFYAGHPGGPAGVFRMTRTLDTPKLSAFLNSDD